MGEVTSVQAVCEKLVLLKEMCIRYVSIALTLSQTIDPIAIP